MGNNNQNELKELRKSRNFYINVAAFESVCCGYDFAMVFNAEKPTYTILYATLGVSMALLTIKNTLKISDCLTKIKKIK